MQRHRIFRSVTDKLNEHMAHIEESGDRVIPPLYYCGGRDWIILFVSDTPTPQQGGAR